MKTGYIYIQQKDGKMDVLVYDFGANGTKKGYFFPPFFLAWILETELVLGEALILWTTRTVIGPTGFLKVGAN